MKQKTTIMAFVWLLLMYSHQVLGSSGGSYLTKLEKTSTAMLAPPAAGFTYVANGGCVPVTVQFYSQLNGPAYSWTFGDGGTSSDCNPVHTYTAPGTYTVTLVATGGTYTTTITVGANPVVTFTGDTVSCQNDIKSYTATSTIAPASYSWSAQGGVVNSSTSTTANVTWSSYGVNYLTYTITTPAGCTKIFRYKVKVIPPPAFNLPCCEKERPDGTQPNKADAAGVVHPGEQEGVKGGEAPCTACAGSYKCYSSTVDPLYGVASDYIWTWTVTNGVINSISADSTTACVTWGASGVGTIKLEVTHKIYGCKSSKECQVIITPGITPVFTVSGNCINTPVAFDASATTPLTDIDSYFWEFGDGYTATTTVPFTTHQFTLIGSYTATLTITTKSGCKYKSTKSFNVISGTKPTIECPGTVCQGSRQCYTTAAIPGAVYNWTISGDVVADRIITGNKVCVTWGNGPVGTVTVTVLGGGYTCTNTATEVVSIVGSVIPIDAPDFICSTLGYLEVSTTNYAGACYKWFINGALQATTSNVLTFNPLSYGNPIRIDVDVDFPIGCCHGRGTKIINKLPQYNMLFYPTNACIGDVVTYSLLLPGGPLLNPTGWSVDGGIIQSSTASTVTIKWTTVGTGTITAGNNSPTQYCNDASNNTWNVTVWAKATGDDISGPAVVCAGTSNTYYHAWQYPTGSATVTVSPSAGVVISPSAYSTVITFPSVAVVTNYVITVTYNHAVVGPCASSKTYTVKSIPATIPTFSGVGIGGGTICQGDIYTYTANFPDMLNYDWNVIGGSVLSQSYVGTTLTVQIQWNSTVTSSFTVNNKACGTSNTQPITVNGKPVVIITTTGPTCSSPNVQLRVAPVWASYLWTPGGTTPTSNTTTVSAVGTYNVTVSNGVCSNTGSVNVPIVTPVPPTITSFNVTLSTGTYCPKYELICPNITPGSGSIVSYAWTFTGFTVSSASGACASVALASSGTSTGTWSLTITDSYGCTSTLGGSLTDNCLPPPPCPLPYAATFTPGGYNPCTGQFTNSATNWSSISWNFGDGTGGSGLNPIHLFTTAACPRTVTAFVTDINGCTQAFPFNINVPYAFGTGVVTATNSPCTGASILTANGITLCPGSPLTPTYTWTLTPVGGGAPYVTGPLSGNTLNVGAIGTLAAGDYNASVSMTVAGCTKVATGTFNKGGLKAYFVSCGGCAGAALSFLDQSVPYSAPLIKWEWTFTPPAGSGLLPITSFLQNPTVIFPPGSGAGPWIWTATLKVTDNIPCTNTFTASFTIQPPFVPGNIRVNGTPTASGTVFNICPGSPYTLTAPPGPYTYSWSNGSSAPSINVTEPGDYYVTVFNTMNCATKVGPIKFLYKPAPEAIILSSAPLCNPALIRAFAGTGYTYNWNYPIGATSTQPYIYATSSGPVTLSVTNVFGCSDTKTQNFTIFPSPYVYISPSSLFCPGSTVSLTANVSGGTPAFNYLWNNGSTAPSISVSSPGLYKVSVLDANFCPAKTQYNLQPVLPTGMDKLPKGCYDICGNSTTFCTGTMPYGWTGQWYLGASPYGAPIPTYGSLATTFTLSGTYTLHYIPIDPTQFCPAISAPIMINFIALPIFTLSTGSVPPVLCTGSTTGILISVDIQSTAYNYTWYLGGSVVGSGYTYTATLPGTYTLIISKGKCCQTSVSITIEEKNCCFGTTTAAFTSILSDTVINTSTFWFNKYYINAVVNVVGSTILDITNVDCVFGPNGTIVFHDDAIIRCNNSVLRPCSKDDIWKGLRFLDASSGWINTTTIKNAIIGVDIDGNSVGVRLSDNSFLKCQIAVKMTKSNRQQSISGNTFEIDESQLPYATTPDEYWGIKMYDTRMSGLIAQNQFRHVQPQNTNNYFMGIYVQQANATISENQFNDMFRSIDVTRNQNVVAIEKNNIKINTLRESYDKYQIRITNCDIPVLVYENQLDNGLANSTAGGIFVESSYRTHIKDNKLNGFSLGMFGSHTDELYIASNTITSSSNVGITLTETRRSVVSCNNINAMNTNGVSRIGIQDINGDGSTSIFSNCIFNMNTPLYIHSANPGNNLPAIYNNYLYNYDKTGLEIVDYVGTLGNPGGPTDAGRNTFMSNNGNVGTLDISSNMGITEDGNFGVLFTSGTSTSSPPDMFYSTAACGQQISSTYNKNELDKYNVCDVYYLDKWVFKTSTGIYTLRESSADMSANMINESLDKKQSTVIGQASAQMFKGENATTTGAQAILDSKMDKNLAARIIVSNCIAVGKPEMASSYLASASLSSINKDLRTILEIVITLAKNPVLTTQQRSALTSIDNMNTVYSPIARDLIQSNVGEHDYKFRKAIVPISEASKAPVISKLSNTISVYPTPASQQITVQHNVKDANVKGLKIVSSTGVEVTSFRYTVQSGVINVDISSLASGVYSVILVTDDDSKALMTGRFIKIQ
ncbi:MAG: PKD domain-containing protein [Bacteroidota bacterium]